MGLKIGLKWSGVAVGEGQERVDGLDGRQDSTVRQQGMQTGARRCLLADCFFCHVGLGNHPLTD